MSEKRKESAWPMVVGIVGIAALLLPLSAIGVYVGGYFLLSTLRGPPEHDILVRDFQHHWQADFYAPLVKVESMAYGEVIEPAWAD